MVDIIHSVFRVCSQITEECVNVHFVDIKKRKKKSDGLNQIWFLAPRKFLRWKRECTSFFFFLCMHE